MEEEERKEEVNKISDFRRMALADSDKTGIRKKTMELIKVGELEAKDQVDIGNALESMTKSAGWACIEKYIQRNSNINEICLGGNEQYRIKAAALIELMQWVDNMIAIKNSLAEAKVEK